jgi:isoquinoline 1-oxidoreductase beta subunit
MKKQRAFNRRDAIKVSTTTGAGLLLSIYLSSCQDALTPSPEISPTTEPTPALDPDAILEPNIYLQLHGTGGVTLFLHKMELGQGIHTSLSMIVAEELDLEMSAIEVKAAPVDFRYGGLYTGGSTSINECYGLLRDAAAVARGRLIAAAALVWEVSIAECSTENGYVIHGTTDRKLPYVELLEVAGLLPDSAVPTLYKNPDEYRFIGQRIPRIEAALMATGGAKYGIDTTLPGMLYASVVRCPEINGGVAQFDASATLNVEGVEEVVQISNGLAVIAENTWAALEGRKALQITWEDGPNVDVSSEMIRAEYEDALAPSGESDANVLQSIYHVPFFAHATMEPMNCVADVRSDSCEIWVPTQNQEDAQRVASVTASISLNDVIIHPTLVGGGFGRRLDVDYVKEAVEISQAVGTPIKLMWTREDDIQHDHYHPLSVHRIQGYLDRMSLPTVSERTYAGFGTKIPTGPWRSVTNFTDAFVRESFIDELANAQGVDPLEFRLEAHTLSLLPVLETAAAESGWGTALPDGWGRGIAGHSTWGVTPVAMVAEVSVDDDWNVRVHRVVCAIECGLVINPSRVEEQMEGGIAFGLTAALKAGINIENGRVLQSNFHDYPLFQIDEMPEVEVYILESDRSVPVGVGEMGVPPIAPAVFNAIFDATGIRVREMPLPMNWYETV